MSGRVRTAVVSVVAAAIVVLSAEPALAHGMSSTVYADVTAGADGHVRTRLELEYDLFVVSTADVEHDDVLFQTGNAAFDAGDTPAQAAALNAHRASAAAYVAGHFTVAADGAGCTPTQVGDYTMGVREG